MNRGDGMGSTIKFVIMDWGSIKKKIFSEIKNRNFKNEGRVLYVDSFEALCKHLTNDRIALLSAVKSKKPSSLFDLAKELKRNLSAVKKDALVLSNLGLLEFEKIGKLARPRIMADKIIIELSI